MLGLAARRVIPSALERLQGVGRLNTARFVMRHSRENDRSLSRLVQRLHANILQAVQSVFLTYSSFTLQCIHTHEK